MSFSPTHLPEHDVWFATDGLLHLGPVSFDALAQEAVRGAISSAAVVRHASWRVWRSLQELRELNAEGRRRMARSLADLSAGVDQRASGPYSVPPPPPSSSDLLQSQIDSTPPPRLSRPVMVDPVGVLAELENFGEAQFTALSTAVAAASAEVGLLHVFRRDLGAAITTYAHGPNAELLLGERIPDDDPTLLAARAGYTIIGEPHPGEAARFIAGRLNRALPGTRGVAMIPLMAKRELVSLLEVGRRFRPFRAREIARVEDVVEALTERAVVAGWLERAAS
jgi:hypothetical protein